MTEPMGLSECCQASIERVRLPHGAYACFCESCGDDTHPISRREAEERLAERLREAQAFNRRSGYA